MDRMKLRNQGIKLPLLLREAERGYRHFDPKLFKIAMNELRTLNDESSFDEIDSAFLFLKENLVYLDMVKQKDYAKEYKKELTGLFLELLELNNFKKEIKKLSKWNMLTDLTLVLEITGEHEMFKPFKLNPSGKGYDEVKNELFFEITSESGCLNFLMNLKPRWNFTNDIFKLNEANNVSELIANYLIKNKTEINEKNCYKDLKWFEAGIDIDFINPSIEWLKHMLVKQLEPYKRDFRSHVTKEPTPKMVERVEEFLRVFVKTNVFKNNIVIQKDVKKACFEFFKKDLAVYGKEFPNLVFDIFNESPTLRFYYFKNKLGQSKNTEIPIKRVKI